MLLVRLGGESRSAADRDGRDAGRRVEKWEGERGGTAQAGTFGVIVLTHVVVVVAVVVVLRVAAAVVVGAAVVVLVAHWAVFTSAVPHTGVQPPRLPSVGCVFQYAFLLLV